MKKVILASKSPRRQMLLKQIFEEFTIDAPKNKETRPFYIPLKKVPEYLATNKAKEVFKRHKDDLIISADTIVYINHKILGKPKDKEDVKRMISLLSGKTHQVITGVCIMSSDFIDSFTAVTNVTFKKLNLKEIEDYCELKTVYDKAGAYAIQEEAKNFVTNIEGEYTTVIGLPIIKLKEKLKEHFII